MTELERILNFGNGTIHRWTIGQPSLDKAKAVCTYFDISLDALADHGICGLSTDSISLAKECESLSNDQKNLLRCYISILKNGQDMQKTS